MKKSLLLMMLCLPMLLAAQQTNGVKVSGLAIDAGTVTFNVSWDKNTMPEALWSDTVWVFVDYNQNGVMERLPVTDASVSAGTVTKIPGNDKGVWVAGNARSAGNFSATVQLFTSKKDVGGACVYASNYPPVGKYTAADKIEFTGTPDYIIVLEKSDKSTYTATVGNGESLSIPSREVIQSFTDKTGAPGILSGIYQPQGSCTYTEPAVVGTFANFDKNYSAATYVSLTDKRDNKNYPVVKIGSRWIMARNLNYQKDLYFNANSNQANGSGFTSASNGTPAIGSFWCPGAHGVMTSTLAACEVWGALYTWETAMMVDGKWTSSMKSSSSWSEPSSYDTNTGSANTQNHARSDAGAVTGGRGICPPNWHVPTDGEWGDILDVMETGTKSHNTGINWRGTDAGTRAKSKCTCPLAARCDTDPDVTSWHGGSDVGTDFYAFRVQPNGSPSYGPGGSFGYRGTNGYTWSSSVANPTDAWVREFDYNQTGTYRNYTARSLGYFVRCIRD
jgi:uncharacterized protein (TIGR02145 family)